MNTNLTINTSRIRGYKKAFYGVSLILIFAISIVMAFAPTASAQIRYTSPRTTRAFVSVAPFLVGVGQQATVNLWVDPIPQDAALSSYYQGYTGISVTFTRPDGTKDTFVPTDGLGIYAPGISDPLGSIFFTYAPNMAGNWSVTMSMPTQNFTDYTGTVLWTACTSAPAYFTVTTQQQNAGLLNGWPYAQLPNSNAYWTYPINSNNREWGAITGDWLQVPGSFAPLVFGSGGRWQPYGSGPATSHLLWDAQIFNGGIVGGLGGVSYEQSGGGNQVNIGIICMEGNAYINHYTLPTPTTPAGVNLFDCYNLATGKLEYRATGQITGGIHYPGNAYAQSAASSSNPLGQEVVLNSFGNVPSPYLFGASSGSTNAGGLATTNWNYYDPLTGTLLRQITNVTVSNYIFVDYSQLAFGCTTAKLNTTTLIFGVNYVWEWNVTKVSNNDWYTGLIWHTTVNNPAKGISGPADGSNRFDISIDTKLSALTYGGGAGDNIVEGFNAQTGASIWNLTLPFSSQASYSQLYNTDNFIMDDPTTSTFNVYSDLTGSLVWSANNVGVEPWNTKVSGNWLCNDNNNVYIANPDGSIIALSLKDGHQVWASPTIPSAGEFVTNNYAFWGYSIIAVGGNIYAYAGYSMNYEIDPIPRFALTVCVNGTTGNIAWTMNGGVAPYAASAGYLLGVGMFDGNDYCWGKGQTLTTVMVPNSAIEGVRVQIQGNVLDQSPAQQGTPAVSDSSMSEQMDYLHMQNATLLNNPPHEQGVQVTLTAVDPNNNTITIGTTTTDSNGNFYLDWTPSTTGDYKITSTFAGSGSYWPSHAETGVVVNSAPPATTSTSGQTSTATGVSTTDLYTIGAAIIVVIIIVGIAIILMQQRKRP